VNQPGGLDKVARVYEGGPADKDWIKLAKGNDPIAIDGKPVKAGDDYDAFLGRRFNRKVELTVSDKPEPECAWRAKHAPITRS
jgi:tricorn protease